MKGFVVHKNERYIGDNKRTKEISAFLKKERQNVPSRFKNHITLNNAIENDDLSIDWKLFEKATKEAEKYFQSIDPNFSLMPHNRYLISQPNAKNIGGFYGRPVGGYYYFNDLGFSTTLDKNVVPNKKLRTLELVRNYLHDSMHSSTYRTFRVDYKTGMIFRHQYGINFRNANRISYSAPNLNDKSPDAINLNTWMDGLVHMQASEFIKQHYSNALYGDKLSPIEQEVWNEVQNMTFDKGIYSEPSEFYETVIEPVKGFMNKWGKGFLFDETLKAMLSGQLDGLKDYFKQTFMHEDAWENMFQQDAYKDIDSIPKQGNNIKYKQTKHSDKRHNRK